MGAPELGHRMAVIGGAVVQHLWSFQEMSLSALSTLDLGIRDQVPLALAVHLRVKCTRHWQTSGTPLPSSASAPGTAGGDHLTVHGACRRGEVPEPDRTIAPAANFKTLVLARSASTRAEIENTANYYFFGKAFTRRSNVLLVSSS
jgi:hypothetical protein